jgi:hypothetical protein
LVTPVIIVDRFPVEVVLIARLGSDPALQPLALPTLVVDVVRDGAVPAVNVMEDVLSYVCV